MVSAGRGETTAEPYTLEITPLGSADGIEHEPNNSLGQANPVRGNKITGYISYKNDKDFFVLDYGRRVRKTFTVRGVSGGEINVSVTDPAGYITKTVNIKGSESAAFSEMVDGRGFIIVEPVVRSYKEPYTVSIGE